MRDFVPVLSCRQAVEFEEKLLSNKEAVWAAMCAAGSALGQTLLRDFSWHGAWPSNPRLLVLAGKGNNAGDALLASVELSHHLPELRVTVIPVYGVNAFKPLASRAFAKLSTLLGSRLAVNEPSEALFQENSKNPFTVTIDGILGAQFRPPVKAPGAAILEWCDRYREALGFRVAVDLPSGLGDEPAEAPFRADVTYATGVMKAPLLVPGAVEWAGRIRYLDLGFFDEAPPVSQSSLLATRRVLEPLARVRAAVSDKRTFGKIFLVGGSPNYPGAILMAALGALRAGGGLVTAMVAEELSIRLATAAPEVMWQSLPTVADGGFKTESVEKVRDLAGDSGVLLLGPGLLVNEANLNFAARLVRECELPMILDAGALRRDLLATLPERPEQAGPVVLTPHAGEFDRLAQRDPGPVSDAELTAFSAQWKAVTVLKGPVTRISDGKSVVYVAAGNPVLARGGSGDILGGILAARLAVQPRDALRAAIEAVAWHGAAADALARERGETAVRTTELLDYLAPALRG